MLQMQHLNIFVSPASLSILFIVFISPVQQESDTQINGSSAI